MHRAIVNQHNKTTMNKQPRDFKVLIACEESQAVCIEFRKIGFEAFSCDIQDCSGGHPEWHIKGDAIKEAYAGNYDLIIAHPPCTFMSKAGARWMYPTAGNVCPERLQKAKEAKEFFMQLLNAPAKHIAVENPEPLKVVGLPEKTQTIQPYEHGDPFSKKTLLWLKSLPNIVPTSIVIDYKPFLPSNTGGGRRGQKAVFTNVSSQKHRSKTFPGIAKAMAEQWGKYLLQ